MRSLMSLCYGPFIQNSTAVEIELFAELSWLYTMPWYNCKHYTLFYCLAIINCMYSWFNRCSAQYGEVGRSILFGNFGQCYHWNSAEMYTILYEMELLLGNAPESLLMAKYVILLSEDENWVWDLVRAVHFLPSLRRWCKYWARVGCRN